MRRVSLAAAVAAFVLCAAPAEAQGWRWLERLSGPGDFTGYEFGQKLWCGYEEAEAPIVEPVMMPPAVSMPCVSKKAVPRSRSRDQRQAGPQQKEARRDRPGAVAPVDGGFVDLTKRVYAFGVAFSYLRGRSDLPYASSDEGTNPTITVLAFEGFYDRRLLHFDRIDWGIAVGANHFVVPAENFTRLSIEPRITLKLFDTEIGDRYIGTASLRIGALALFGEFDAADFGATGPYSSNGSVEWGPSVRFILDFDRNPFSSR